MEKLLEQAQQLVRDLQSEKKAVADQKAALNKKANEQVTVQASLDQFQAELLQREINIKPIENAQNLIASANQAKADSDLSQHTLNGDWDKLNTAKKNFAIEQEAGRKEIAEQKALYNRGAEENKEAKSKLDARLKKFEEARAGV